MDRTEELLNGTQKEKAKQLLEEVEFLEGKLKELKKMPFLSVNPKNPAQQKTTPAAKLYKDLNQQYNNSMKLLLRMLGDLGEVEEDSPLRRWIKGRKEFE